MKESFSLEENLDEIRHIVDEMQKGVSDFDEQLSLFKKGKTLIKGCQKYLDEAEMEVKKWVDGKLEDFPEP